MKLKEVLVFVLLAASIIAAFGGFALVSRGETMGWAGVAIAVPMLFVVQRAMRATSTATPIDDVKPVPKASAEG
jgi:hypothetical protein